MLDFAGKVGEEPWAVDESDHAELAEHGFDDEDAWDIAAITGFFGLSNRMAHISGMIPNPEFHLLGRVQIGRASCRERVKSSGVDGAVEEIKRGSRIRTIEIEKRDRKTVIARRPQ